MRIIDWDLLKEAIDYIQAEPALARYEIRRNYFPYFYNKDVAFIISILRNIEGIITLTVIKREGDDQGKILDAEMFVGEPEEFYSLITKAIDWITAR